MQFIKPKLETLVTSWTIRDNLTFYEIPFKIPKILSDKNKKSIYLRISIT